jgi:hypothetical protein
VTRFIRVLEAAVDEKATHLKAAVDALGEDRAPARNPHPTVFECDPKQFSQVPGSPFAYWVSEAVRSIFGRLDPFESEGRSAAVGLQTSDDFRFVRAGWEVAPDGMGRRWFPFAKGGARSPFYSDVYLTVKCVENFAENVAYTNERYEYLKGNARSLLHSEVSRYFRPGLTWPLRTQSGFGIRVMSTGCIFGHKGPAAFVEGDSPGQLLALLAITTSTSFCYLVELQMAFGSYEVGVIQRTPVPELSTADTRALGALARWAWSLKRSLDTTNETSHAFLLPSGLNERITGLDGAAVESELAQIQQQVDDRAFELYYYYYYWVTKLTGPPRRL